MINYAIARAFEGEEVVLYSHNKDYLKRIFNEILTEKGIVMDYYNCQSRYDVPGGKGRITIRQSTGKAEVVEIIASPIRLVPSGSYSKSKPPKPDRAIRHIADHYLIEMFYADVLNDFHRWDYDNESENDSKAK